MEQNKLVWVMAAIVSAALSGVAIAIGVTGLPTMRAVIAAGVVDTIGVWVFTWALIAIVAIVGLVIAGACASVARSIGRPEETPGHSRAA